MRLSLTLAVTAARLATAGGATTGDPKTKTSVRTLPMPDDLTAALRRVRKRQKEQKLALGSKWINSGYVVVDEFGTAPYQNCATPMHLNGVPTVVIAAWLADAAAILGSITTGRANHAK